MSMSWQYIAGFFDGEGCIAYSTGKRPNGSAIQVTMTQTSEPVLLQIQDFLRVHGIVSHVRKYKPSNGSHKTRYLLTITGRNSIVRALSGMLPFLIVKRTISQDYIRWFRIYPSLKPEQGRPFYPAILAHSKEHLFRKRAV